MFAFLNPTNRSYVKNNLSLAWPLAMNALLMQSMLMIDTFLVSPLGEISLAAMGIATTIVAFTMGIQMALANGTQLVLSRSVGSSNQLAVTKGYWAGLTINTSVAVMFWLILTVFDQQLVSFLTEERDLISETLVYLSVSKYIIIFNALTQVTISLFNAMGRTKVPFKGYLLELPVNVGVSYLLIYGVFGAPELGVEGAAWGSLTAIVLRAVYLLIVLRRSPTLELNIKHLDLSIRSNMAKHFLEIFPVAANITMLQAGATIYQLLYSQLNINAYVAITLIMPWLRAGTQFITAWAHSSAITISQAIGSRQLTNLRRNVDVSIDIAVVISCISALAFVGLSLSLPMFYPDLEAETHLALATIAPLYIFLPIVRGYNTVHGHVLRALGKTTEVFKINFTGQWIVSIPLCALIIFYFDASVFWAFAIFPFEEMIKMYPFRYLARKSLNNFDEKQLSKLMYD